MDTRPPPPDPVLMMTLSTWAPWFHAALAGMAEPWVVMVALVLCTFLLEDLAIAAGAALAVQGLLSWPEAFVAVAGGIALGDLGLYGLGRAAHSVPLLHRRYIQTHQGQWARSQLCDRLFGAVALARVIPGLRLVTYTACGFLGIPFGRFVLWVVLATSVWTGALYALSVTVGDLLSRTLGWPAPVAVAVPIVFFVLAVPLVRALRRRGRLTTAQRTAP